MLHEIAWFSLGMCLSNWLLFVVITVVVDLPQLKALLDALRSSSSSSPPGMGLTVQQAAIDPVKLASVTGSLAGAFKKAGPAPTAAALSVLFLIAALIAAGVDKI
jgi:hypothetical protein